jgi:iduronate 2-sulfatase
MWNRRLRAVMFSTLGAVAVVLADGWSTVRAADAPAAAGRKPNVLLIVSDDLGARLGCYGDPQVRSPNVDKLAARGVRFDRAYCQFPLCNPSRASFMTGLRPDTLRVYDLQTNFRSTVPEAVSVGQTFQKAGYFVARVGKIYHYGVPAQIGTDGMDDAPTWAERYNPAGRDVKEDRAKIVRTEYDPMSKATVLKDQNALTQMGGTLSWLASEGTDAEFTDAKVADQAIKLLEEHGPAAAGAVGGVGASGAGGKADAKPFFLAVGFYRPHTPYVAPKVPYFGFYPVEKVPVWEEPAGWRGTVPPISLVLRPDQEHMSADLKRQAVQAYYASTSYMDAQAGRVLDALDRLKLADDTIVVFTSDHGYQLGEHAQWQKMSLFEHAARVPLVIAAPGGAKGTVSPRPVELVDLHATLTDLAGLAVPKTDGQSLKPLVMKADAAWDKPAVTQVTRAPGGGRPGGGAAAKAKQVMGYSVRTERYRYTEWDGGTRGVELYDEQADPAEMRNLAAEPEQAAVVAKLKALLPTASAGDGRK